MQQRHLSSRPVSRFRWTSRIWVTRPVGAVKMKLSEKIPAAQVSFCGVKIWPHSASLYLSTHAWRFLPFSEFDDLEMCTSLSHHQDSEGLNSAWYSENSKEGLDIRDESTPLHHLVQDLRSQLTRCHKVIRGLQLRVRSLSATSDYASSLERTPRKVRLSKIFHSRWLVVHSKAFGFILTFQVNWALGISPAPSGVEEDEGWMSDTQGVRPTSKPSRELQELMERVASLEAQLKNTAEEGKQQAEEEKCATWPRWDKWEKEFKKPLELSVDSTVFPALS